MVCLGGFVVFVVAPLKESARDGEKRSLCLRRPAASSTELCPSAADRFNKGVPAPPLCRGTERASEGALF